MAQIWKRETPEQYEKVVVTHDDGVEHHRRVVENPAAAQRQFLSKVTQLIWLMFGILEGLIALRIMLRLFAANPANPFAVLVYRITDAFLWPFTGLVPDFGLLSGMVFELSSIIAMLVYALIGWVIVKLVWLLFYHPTTHVVETYDEHDPHTHVIETHDHE